MGSNVVSNLSQLADDKAAFRQLDLKLINAPNYVQRGYGHSVERLN